MAIWVGLLTLEVQVPGASSLKDKRQVLRSLTQRLRNTFNVSVAEVDQQDSWQMAVLAVVCVSADRRYAQGLMSQLVDFVESGRFDLVLLDYQTEFL